METSSLSLTSSAGLQCPLPKIEGFEDEEDQDWPLSVVSFLPLSLLLKLGLWLLLSSSLTATSPRGLFKMSNSWLVLQWRWWCWLMLMSLKEKSQEEEEALLAAISSIHNCFSVINMEMLFGREEEGEEKCNWDLREMSRQLLDYYHRRRRKTYVSAFAYYIYTYVNVCHKYYF